MLDVAYISRPSQVDYRRSAPRPASQANDPVDGVTLSGGVPGPEPLAAEPAPVAPARRAAAADPLLADLPATRLGAAWKSTWVRAESYNQDRIDLPFPYAATEGMLECNDLYWTVQGMKALGANAAAQGVLENWLSLGERYTALPGANQLNELGRSGMPRLSSLLVEATASCPDPQLQDRAYRVLEGDYRNNWCDAYFKQTPNGLNRFCDVDYSHDATLIESGGEKNRARFEGDASRYNAVDLNAYLYQTEKDLQTLAPRGRKEAWGEAAQKRKEQILDQLWDPQQGFFYDVDWRSGLRSDKPCLAAYSLLEAGVLDPRTDRDKVEALVGKLGSFKDAATGLPSWQPGDARPAQATDVMTVVKGLERYGYEAEAESLKACLKAHLASQPLGKSPAELGVRSYLEGQRPAAPALPEQYLSPAGQDRLQTVFPGATVSAAQAGPVDRRLRQLHSSLLEPQLIQSLQQRGLTQAVYGLSLGSQGITRSDAPVALPGGRDGDLQLEGLTLGLPAGVRHGQIAPGAFQLQAGDDRLTIVQDGNQLVIGDRAYDLKAVAPEGRLRLPRDIFQSFDLAGDNPQLESFFDHHREWLAPLAVGPKTEARMGDWGKLFDTIGDNWKALTIDPSVTAKDTASQIFNRAAVPSLGIFKTQFNWDTLFMAEGMKLQGQGQTVAGMTDNLLYLLKSTGRVPNAARSVYLNKSQAPVLPALVRMSTPIRDEENGQAATARWLGAAYDLMKDDYHEFWNRPGQRGVDSIDGQPTRLSRHWGPNHKFAMDESGYDTTSRLDGKALDLVGPDVNAFLYRYSQDMGAIASQLAEKAAARGDRAEERRYRGEATRWEGECLARKHDVIKYCWDEKDGMFRDFNTRTGQLERSQDTLAPMIAPLWVGMLDPGSPMEKRMIDRSLDNLSRFEKTHGLAATAQDYGHPEMQWNGPSGWAPLHMMALEALDRYGRYDDASRIAAKWVNLVNTNKNKDGAILERYNVVTGGAPPVQQGRYEETQGEGPGFGWTNGSVAWTMVEVVAGLKANNGRLDVAPHLPEELSGQEVDVNYQDQWQVRQSYDAHKGSYNLQVSGDLSQGLDVTTPPLARGILPRLQGVRPESYTIRQLPAGEGKVQYVFDFDSQAGGSLSLTLEGEVRRG